MLTSFKDNQERDSGLVATTISFGNLYDKSNGFKEPTPPAYAQLTLQSGHANWQLAHVYCPSGGACKTVALAGWQAGRALLEAPTVDAQEIDAKKIVGQKRSKLERMKQQVDELKGTSYNSIEDEDGTNMLSAMEKTVSIGLNLLKRQARERDDLLAADKLMRKRYSDILPDRKNLVPAQDDFVAATYATKIKDHTKTFFSCKYHDWRWRGQ